VSIARVPEVVIVPPVIPVPLLVATEVTVPPASIKVSAIEIVPAASMRKALVPGAEGSPDIRTPLWKYAPLRTDRAESVLTPFKPIPTLPLTDNPFVGPTTFVEYPIVALPPTFNLLELLVKFAPILTTPLEVILIASVWKGAKLIYVVLVVDILPPLSSPFSTILLLAVPAPIVADPASRISKL
jgi:hypothetical protein